MEQKFTKGEWKLSNQDTFGRQMVDLGEFKGSVDVWYHHGDAMTKEEAKANARLIACAPKLLEACQSLINDFEADFLLNGKIVDNPSNLLVVNYQIAKEAVESALGS